MKEHIKQKTHFTVTSPAPGAAGCVAATRARVQGWSGAQPAASCTKALAVAVLPWSKQRHLQVSGQGNKSPGNRTISKCICQLRLLSVC